MHFPEGQQGVGERQPLMYKRAYFMFEMHTSAASGVIYYRKGDTPMKVECKISADSKEPYAVLHINRMTPSIAEIISMLEKEDTNSLTLIAAKERKTYFIKPEDICLVRTEGREIVCYDKLKSRYTLDKPLYELENILANHFVRISKSSIVNIRQIRHVEASFNGTMELVMKNGITDYISRNFRKSFKERLGLE